MTELSMEHQHFIIKYLSERLAAHTVILFGSAARGTMRQDSDVDIAFMTDRGYSAYQLFMHAQELADYMGREVDLVDFRQASAVFRAQIVGNGKLLLDNQPAQRQLVYMRALKEYALLNEERAAILEKYGYKGGIHVEQRHHHEQNGDHPALHTENT